MFSKKLKFIFLFFYLSNAYSSFEDAEKIYGKSSAGLSGYKTIIKELVEDGYYFSVLPWVKDYLYKSDGNLPRSVESSIDVMSMATGTKILDTLPEKYLKRSSSSTIRYILAKRYLRRNKHLEAIAELNRVNRNDINYPFVLNLRGAVSSSIGQYDSAINDFYECISVSKQRISERESDLFNSQLQLNKDVCLAGLARARFGQRNYQESELLFLDISKDSYIWPNILLEEAWTSYYQKNYNRTLGKLVSYNAPLFDFIVNPEIEVLKALSYLKLCLYEDAKKVVDGFYSENEDVYKKMKSILENNKKNNLYFYQLIVDNELGRSMPYEFLGPYLKSIRKDPAVMSIRNSLSLAVSEHKRLSRKSRSNLKINLMRNLQIISDDYKNLIGSFVRKSLLQKAEELNYAFAGMSYIKLEVLAQRKEDLYQDQIGNNKKRGDIKYLERNEKQYFWSFNGEFWADELGDYVFALRSECK